MAALQYIGVQREDVLLETEATGVPEVALVHHFTQSQLADRAAVRLTAGHQVGAWTGDSLQGTRLDLTLGHYDGDSWIQGKIEK